MVTLFFAVRPLHAQVQFGQITGLITDPSGAVVPAATVTVNSQQTGVKKSAETNANGEYTITPLIPGVYDVTVAKAGFKSATHSGIILDVAQTARVDVALEVGQVSQEVTVKSAGELLQTERASVGNVVAEAGVVNLPLNGRDYLQLATLVPGMSSSSLNTIFYTLPENILYFNGMRASAINYVIDGSDVMEQWTSGSPFTPPPDAIQEFKVETNSMSAEYGNGGSVINAVLKSGTNKYHGDVYEFLRNNALNARNTFSPTVPATKQNQFGFTLGGPIKKDKLFFFGDYQGTRVVNGVTKNDIVPTAAEKIGDFSALSTSLVNPYTGVAFTNNQVPVSTQAAYLMQFYPSPNTPQGTFVWSPNSTSRVNQFDIRMDGQMRSKDSFTATWSYDKVYTYTAGSFPNNGATYGPSLIQFGNASWTHNFGAAMVNQVHVAYERTTAYETGQGIGTNYTVQAGIGGFGLTSLAYPGPPNLSITGFTTLSGYDFVPLPQTYNQFNTGDMLTLIKGKHTLQFGADARWYAGFNLNGAHSRGDFTFTGVYTGNAFADFVYGVPYSGGRSFPRNWFGSYEQSFDSFVQDTWKVTPRLTLIGGLRYDLMPPNTSLNNSYASLNPYTNQIIVASDKNGNINTNGQQVEQFLIPLFQSYIVPSSKVGLGPSLAYTDYTSFGPRLGIAYQAKHGFVVRTGYGVFYLLNQTNQTISSGIVNPPFLADETGIFNTTPVPTKNLGTFFSPQVVGQPLNLSPLTFFWLDPNERRPYVQEWNASVQKLIGSALTVQASYVGSKGTKLTFSAPENVPLPGPGAIQSRRMNQNFSGGNLISTQGLSSYNALQVTAETRSYHGLYLLGAYTWSKSLDNQSGDSQGTPVQDPNNLPAEYGISSFNLPQRLTLSSTYALPFLRNRPGYVGTAFGGWTMSNIITLQDGSPFTVVPATSPANTGTSMRAERIANGKLANPTINEWFDLTAFTTPPLYTYGNAARDILSGPGTRNWDFSLFKDFRVSRLGEGARIQFRGEFFNFTNTAHFALPGATIGSPEPASAGKITSAGAPRQIQLVLKIIF
jgi:hypothetical protein